MPHLHWIGKDKVVNHHLDVPFHILNQKYKTTTNTENKIIHGDNLLALKALLPQYEGKIKCIYIDPPYNTGNEQWVYNDNVNDPKIQKWLGQVVGKEAEDLTRHDKWLCMMYPRLKLLHKLLSDDGAIFISIDDNEQAHLKLICDEIFGSGNFLANIIWQKKFSPQNDAKYFSDMHDFIICYSKNKLNFKINQLARTEEAINRYKNLDNDPRGVWSSSDMSVKRMTERDTYEIITPSGRKVLPPKGSSWRLSKETFENYLRDNKIWFGEKGDNVPRIKRFLSEVKDGVTPLTMWLHEEVGHNQEAKQEIKKIFFESNNPFETPKPTRLIERILQLSTDKNSLILDSFGGSGTTAHAVVNLNKADGGDRKFILVEMGDYAENITAERVRRVGGDFSYYELGETLFLENGFLNEKIDVNVLREYIYYSETSQSALPNNGAEGETEYFLGNNNEVSYYFYCKFGETTYLDYDFLANMKTKASQYVIYADNCLLDDAFLVKNGIIFKKIPRDVRRF